MLSKNNSSADKKSITSIAIGGFDGMHTAHQTLFSNLSRKGAIIVIDSGYANLTPFNNREEYSSYPIFYYALEDIKALSGQEFVNLLVQEFPLLNKIVVGFDFHFGKYRSCGTKELKHFFEGEVIVLNEISVNNIAIHTRVIREYLKNADIKNANILLGKSYKIRGLHIKGQGLGKTDFFPTINIEVKDYLLPKDGVYISKTIVDEQVYDSVTFLGHRTSTDGKYAVETHILNKDIFVKNEKIEIKFCKYIRENQKFDSFKALKNQIQMDIKNTKEYFHN